jgi:hypothetical protein
MMKKFNPIIISRMSIHQFIYGWLACTKASQFPAVHIIRIAPSQLVTLQKIIDWATTRFVPLADDECIIWPWKEDLPGASLPHFFQ